MPPAEIIDKQLKHLNFKNSALRKSCKADPPEISKHGSFQGGNWRGARRRPAPGRRPHLRGSPGLGQRHG